MVVAAVGDRGRCLAVVVAGERCGSGDGRWQRLATVGRRPEQSKGGEENRAVVGLGRLL